jgi:hypothetical protein
VTALIVERPLCLPCIVEKAGITPAEVDAALAHIARALTPDVDHEGRCRACGSIRTVISLPRPSE